MVFDDRKKDEERSDKADRQAQEDQRQAEKKEADQSPDHRYTDWASI